MGYGDLSSADWARIRTQRDPLLESVYPIPYRPPSGGPGPSPVESYQEPQPKESPLQREVRELRSRVRELEGRLASLTEAQTSSSDGPTYTCFSRSEPPDLRSYYIREIIETDNIFFAALVSGRKTLGRDPSVIKELSPKDRLRYYDAVEKDQLGLSSY